MLFFKFYLHSWYNDYYGNINVGKKLMKYVNIERMNLKFKNIVSAPAPLGRMLNYLLYAEKVGLVYKAGYRSIDLKGNIGYSWTIDLMVGLGLLYLRDTYANATYRLYLTNKGKALYELIQDKPLGYFNESTNTQSILAIKGQFGRNGKQFIAVFEQIFRASPLYRNLCIYLQDHPKIVEKNVFYRDYFMDLSRCYTRSGTEDNAGFNRLTSLMQICLFLGYISIQKDIIHFKMDKFC